MVGLFSIDSIDSIVILSNAESTADASGNLTVSLSLSLSAVKNKSFSSCLLLNKPWLNIFSPVNGLVIFVNPLSLSKAS